MVQFSAMAQGVAGTARLIARNFSPQGGIYCAFRIVATFKALACLLKITLHWANIFRQRVRKRCGIQIVIPIESNSIRLTCLDFHLQFNVCYALIVMTVNSCY